MDKLYALLRDSPMDEVHKLLEARGWKPQEGRWLPPDLPEFLDPLPIPQQKIPEVSPGAIEAYRVERPWLAVCEACPNLVERNRVGGKCLVFFSLPEYKDCGCRGRVTEIIPSRESCCPLGYHDHIEELQHAR